MDIQAVYERVKREFGEEGIEFLSERPQPGFQVAREKIVELASFLRETEDLRFDMLTSLAGVDLPEGVLRTSYHVYSFEVDLLLPLHVDVTREDPSTPSVAHIWPAADWYERESWDLVGIVYEGHPDLRRIMLPDDWEGHPLRKDYEEKPEYHGIPTQREREWLSWQK